MTEIRADEAAAFVDSFEAFWAHPEPVKLHELLWPDVHLVQPLVPEMHSCDEYVEQLRQLLSVCPDLAGELRRWDRTDDGVVIEHTLGGTIKGKRFELRVFDRIVLRDGKVVERVAYFDPSPLLVAIATRPQAWLPYLRTKLQRLV